MNSSPRCVGLQGLQGAFPGWTVIDEHAYEKSALPRPLKNLDLRFYRLQRLHAASP